METAAKPSRSAAAGLRAIARRIVACERCPRLRRHCLEIARRKRRAFRDEVYWGLPVPGFGDPEALLVVVGLAPAAHGGNRTGRVFTGDPSGSWLYEALHTYGFANQSLAVSRDDGLELRGAYVCAAARCAPPDNRPTREELENCRPYLAAELRRLRRARVVVGLGGVAWEALLRVWGAAGVGLPRPRPRFAHGAEVALGPKLPVLLGSYHPSRRNQQTRLLTRRMFHAVFARARVLVGAAPPDPVPCSRT
jgi:uracil-DNA glycosylase family 4